MIELLSESSETCIGFKFSGKVSTEDYDVLLPKLDDAISAHGTINLLVVMDDFQGWAGLGAAKDDFEFGTHQYRKVGKAAFVGEKKWQEVMIKVMDPFTRRTDERFFNPDELDAAWKWIKKES